MNNTLSIFFFSGLALGWWVMLTLCFSHTFCILEKIWHLPFLYSWSWLYHLKGKTRAVSGNSFWKSIFIHLGYPERYLWKILIIYDGKKIKQYFVKPKLLHTIKIALSKNSSKQMQILNGCHTHIIFVQLNKLSSSFGFMWAIHLTTNNELPVRLPPHKYTPNSSCWDVKL